MEYTLMHKSIPVLDIGLDDATGSVQKLGELHRIEHLPLGTVDRHGIVDRTALNTWWIDRCIPASRSGVRQALETLDISTPHLLLTRCFGLSLSDQYWVKPEGSDLQWNQMDLR